MYPTHRLELRNFFRICNFWESAAVGVCNGVILMFICLQLCCFRTFQAWAVVTQRNYDRHTIFMRLRTSVAFGFENLRSAQTSVRTGFGQNLRSENANPRSEKSKPRPALFIATRGYFMYVINHQKRLKCFPTFFTHFSLGKTLAITKNEITHSPSRAYARSVDNKKVNDIIINANQCTMMIKGYFPKQTSKQKGIFVDFH